MLRLSGPGVDTLAHELLSPSPTTRWAGPARLRLDAEPGASARELPVLALRFQAPASYTGEDVLELLLPGNTTLIERVRRMFESRPGVRCAGPGEFSARAYLHGRLSLEQAEGVAASIAAVNETQRLAARDLLSGRTGEQYHAWADELATLAALVEAGIDFTDQDDVQPIAAWELVARVNALAASIESSLGGRAGRAAAGTEPLVVLFGSPNAGKSTLFNALLGRARTLTSPHAGTTRDVIEEPLELAAAAPGAGVVRLADCAGLDAFDTSSPAARAARDATLAGVLDADVVLWCEPAGEFSPERAPRTHGVVLRVRTFCDRPGIETGALRVCGLDGRGLGDLRRAVASAATASRAAGVAALLPRHRAAMHAALRALTDLNVRAEPGARRIDNPELVAESLRAALDAVGELAGRITPDALIGRVFATFCVGK